ncbi:MAG: hypothetical protein E7241_09090 [Lachnospiraceae bacterium]|nr:hypothetical protein [Lachnospiraceae bacterium]
MRRREKNRIVERTSIIKCIAFFLLMGIGAVTALIIPLRPTKSDLEKRELAKFPEFTLASFLDGSYFSQIDTWYSDTFPFREQLLACNSFLQSFNGIGSVQIHGNVQAGDEIPTESGELATLEEDTSSEEPSSVTPSTEEDVNVPTQTLGPVFVAGNSAYEFYRFGKDASTKYAAVINTAAEKFEGTASVYDIIIPNSMGVVLPDKIRENINTSDQREAINYMYSVMSDKVKKVNIFDTLKSHKGEYIYFRTDHHWTQLGAYYAYTEFCKSKGISPKPLEYYEVKQFEGFLGSFYSDSGQAPELAKTPDTVYAYYPKATNKMTYLDRKGNEGSWNIINDVSSWGAGSKYNCFIGGDNPLSTIVNPEINDGSAVVVVKESYGNAFVPFLVDHYNYVYVVDYRYYQGKLGDLVAEKGIKDVIYINNIMATGTNVRINDLIRITK